MFLHLSIWNIYTPCEPSLTDACDGCHTLPSVTKRLLQYPFKGYIFYSILLDGMVQSVMLFHPLFFCSILLYTCQMRAKRILFWPPQLYPLHSTIKKSLLVSMDAIVTNPRLHEISVPNSRKGDCIHQDVRQTFLFIYLLKSSNVSTQADKPCANTEHIYVYQLRHNQSLNYSAPQLI